MGCDDQDELPQQPAVIKKKIFVQKDVALKTEKPKRINTSTSESKIDILKAIAPNVSDVPDASVQAPANDFYVPEGKIDPFARFDGDKLVDMTDGDGKERIPLTPLEKIDLGQLKLTGVIRSSSGNKAMVEEASGKGYTIKRGTRIGIHSGIVTKILKDRIVVEEEVEDVLGKITIDEKELKLQKPPGE